MVFYLHYVAKIVQFKSSLEPIEIHSSESSIQVEVAEFEALCIGSKDFYLSIHQKQMMNIDKVKSSYIRKKVFLVGPCTYIVLHGYQWFFV